MSNDEKSTQPTSTDAFRRSSSAPLADRAVVKHEQEELERQEQDDLFRAAYAPKPARI